MKINTHIRAGFIPVAIAQVLLSTPPHFLITFLLGLVATVFADIDLLLGIRHRYITHSIPFALLTSIPIYAFLGLEGSLVWFVAYASHLFLDSLTPYGVPAFYPFTEKRYGYRKLKSGGFFDNWIVLYGIFFAVAIGVGTVEQLIYIII